ncbi:MAG: transcriptional repressor LexA [Nitrospinota bacterium]
MTLTKKQKLILDFIAAFIEREGYAPSIAEIKKEFGVNSPATVHQHLKNLEAKGAIRRIPNRHRSIEIVQASPSAGKGRRVPVLGAISAGSPIESFPDTETISLPEEMAPGSESYLLRVRGNSMIEDHILNGDMVIVKKSNVAAPGQTVVALIDGSEATLKKFFFENGKIRLQPANPEMKPMVFDTNRVQIQGIVTGILRKFS